MMPMTPVRRRFRQSGAALLAAMLTVTLVASFAASALWQQWRAVEVETAERAHIQSAWMLVGALDWSRLILREDARAGGADHLAEPWAVSLQEARLSTFLAVDRNAVQADDASTDTSEAFLSGQIIDMQSLLNVNNLAVAGQVQALSLAQFTRLFTQLGLPQQELLQMAEQLRQTTDQESASIRQAPLQPVKVSQLGWLGLSPATLSVLAPYVSVLPMRTLVNINTAPIEVLMAAVEGLDMARAQKIVTTRESRHFRTLSEVNAVLDSGMDCACTVQSSYFEVRGRLRLQDTVVEERSLVRRQGAQVTTLWRERGAFGQDQTAPPGSVIR